MPVQTTPLEVRLTDPHAFKVSTAGGTPVFEVDTLTLAAALSGRFSAERYVAYRGTGAITFGDALIIQSDTIPTLAVQTAAGVRKFEALSGGAQGINLFESSTSIDTIRIFLDGEASARAVLNADSLAFGPGGILGRDVNLYRQGADILATDDSLQLRGTNREVLVTPAAAAAGYGFSYIVQGEANPLMRLSRDRLEFGAGGASAVDVVLSRGAANRLDLATGDFLRLISGDIELINTAVLDIWNNFADVNPLARYSDDRIEFGAGGASALDVNLYRTAADKLKTDDMLIASSLGIGIDTIPAGGFGEALVGFEGAVGAAGPHVQFTTTADDYPLMQMLMFAHGNIALNFDLYWDSVTSWTKSFAGTGWQIYCVGNELQFNFTTGVGGGGTPAGLDTAFRFYNTGQVDIRRQGSGSGVRLGASAGAANAVQLYWGANNRLDLATGDDFRLVSGDIELIGTKVLDIWNAFGDANPLARYSDDRIEFGAGGAGALDVNLYRSAADLLATDDSFQVGASILFDSSGFAELTEIALPSAPAVSKGRLFAPVLDENDSISPGTGMTGLYVRRNQDWLMTKLSDDFPYSTKMRHPYSATTPHGDTDEPDTENSWVNYGPTWESAKFIKDFLGCVWVQGFVKSGASNTVFSLPEGYWNTGGDLRWATITNPDAFGMLDFAGGDDVSAGLYSATWFSLMRMAYPETSRITWHDVGGGGEPAFENSWVNFGAAWDTAAFAKDAIGRVWIKGMVKDGVDDAAIFTLPAGYRPTAGIHMIGASDNNVIATLYVLADGTVKVNLLGAGTNAWATITAVFTADGEGPGWTEIGSGGSAPAFENSWANYDAGWDTAGFYKDACGIVHVKGLIKDGTIGQTAFTLPVGYRPKRGLHVATISNDAMAKIYAYEDGRVQAFVGNNAWFSMHFSFIAEQ